MRAGLRGAGLKPAEFWALSPVELMVMLGREGGGGAGALGRDGLETLLALYPDQMRDGDANG